MLAVALSLPGVLVAWVGRRMGGPPSPPSAAHRDRRDPRSGAPAIPLAALAHVLSLPVLYCVAAITGICTVLFNLADHVYITDLVSRKRLLDANGKRSAVDSVAEISGPALGGALVALWTAPIAIAADAATFVASAVLIARIRKPETHPHPARAHIVRRRRAHRHTCRVEHAADPHAVPGDDAVHAVRKLHGIAVYAVRVARPGAVARAAGHWRSAAAASADLIGAALAAPAAARWGTRRTLMASLALTAIMQVFIPLAPAVPWIAMLFLVAQQIVGDGAMTVYLVNETTLRQRLLPQEALGRSAATWQVATGLLTPAGALLGAVLAESVRPAPDALGTGRGFRGGVRAARRRARHAAGT